MKTKLQWHIIQGNKTQTFLEDSIDWTFHSVQFYAEFNQYYNVHVLEIISPNQNAEQVLNYIVKLVDKKTQQPVWQNHPNQKNHAQIIFNMAQREIIKI